VRTGGDWTGNVAWIQFPLTKEVETAHIH